MRAAYVTDLGFVSHLHIAFRRTGRRGILFHCCWDVFAFRFNKDKDMHKPRRLEDALSDSTYKQNDIEYLVKKW